MTTKRKAKLRLVRSAASPAQRVSLSFNPEDRLTKQSFKAECDIDTIMRQYTQTGIINHTNAAAAVYGDVPEIDFRQAMEVVLQGEQTFASLPSDIRKRFENDPAQYLSFCDDPDNYDEAIELGLAEAPPLPPEDPPPADPPPPPPLPAEGA